MKKLNNLSAFTLIEVMVAASILSITVFGVYKLIGENTKLVSNHEQYSFANTLFPTLQECIEHLGFTNFNDSTTYYFNFWTNWDDCNSETSLTNTIELDNIEYTLSGTTSSDISQKIDWTLEVQSDTIKPITKNYTQLP